MIQSVAEIAEHRVGGVKIQHPVRLGKTEIAARAHHFHAVDIRDADVVQALPVLGILYHPQHLFGAGLFPVFLAENHEVIVTAREYTADILQFNVQNPPLQQPE